MFIGAPGCGEHLRQHDCVVTLTKVSDENSKTAIQCNNLGGGELATLEVDASFQSIAKFRANLSVRLGRPNACLKIVLPNASILPLGGSQEVLLEALMLKPSDVPSTDCDERQTGCLVQ